MHMSVRALRNSAGPFSLFTISIIISCPCPELYSKLKFYSSWLPHDAICFREGGYWWADKDWKWGQDKCDKRNDTFLTVIRKLIGLYAVGRYIHMFYNALFLHINLLSQSLFPYLHLSLPICGTLPLIKYSQLVPLNIHCTALLRLSALYQPASSMSTRSPSKARKHTYTEESAAWSVAAWGGWIGQNTVVAKLRIRQKKRQSGWKRNETQEKIWWRSSTGKKCEIQSSALVHVQWEQRSHAPQ